MPLVLTRAVAMLGSAQSPAMRAIEATGIYQYCSLQNYATRIDETLGRARNLNSRRISDYRTRPNTFRRLLQSLLCSVKDITFDGMRHRCGSCHECQSRTGNGFANYDDESSYLELRRIAGI